MTYAAMTQSSEAERVALMRKARQGLQQRLQDLASKVDQVAADQGFRGLLRGMSKLWRYGSFNQYLIWTARPRATAVAGRRQWEALGRTVREGERGIAILAPRRSGVAGYPFIMVEVFDISQTDGPPPPPRSDFRSPKGACPRLPDIESAASRLRIEVEPVPAFRNEWGEDTAVLGLARPRQRKVQIRETLRGLERARTLLHEYAHVLLLQPQRRRSKGGPPRQVHPSHAICEAEADATAFLVLDVLGLPSPAPTYIAWMGGRGSLLLASMQRILAASRAILRAIDGETPVIRIPRLPRAG